MSGTRTLLGIGLLALCLAGLRAAGQGVYAEIQADLAVHANRLPGSAGGEAALAVIEARLRAAGLQTGRQTFETVVPRTELCRLAVEGRPVSPAYPCENGVAPFITDGPWRGPVVFAGSGWLVDLEGLDLRGAFAVIDLDAPQPSVDEVFMHGARAAILVGGTDTSQWNLGGVLADGPALVPRIYVPRAAAEAAGLLRTDGARQSAELEVRVTLETVETANLWAVLPGRAGAVGKLGSEEALVLSAVLGTYGLTPDANPSLRRAANAALLADVVCALAAAPAPRRRTVVAVWFGSAYGNQDGARFFYHAIGPDGAAGSEGPLTERLQALDEEAEELNALLALAGRTDLFAERDDTSRLFTRAVRQLLAARVNEANADLRNLNVRLAAAGADTEIDAAIQGLAARKAEWNSLRMQILQKRERPAEASLASYREAVTVVAGQFMRRGAEVEREIRHVKSWIEAGRPFVGREIVGHFDFDFSNAADPWTFSMIHASFPQRADLQPGHYLMHLDRLGAIYAGVTDPAWPAPLFTGAVNPFYKPFSLSTPRIQTAPSSVGLALGVAGFQMVTVGEAQAADPLSARKPVDLAPLAVQLRVFSDALASSPELSLRRVALPVRTSPRLTYARGKHAGYSGTQFVTLARGSSEETGPAARGLVTVPTGSAGALCGDSVIPRGALNGHGMLMMPMIAQDVANSSPACAFGFDGTGRLTRFGGGRNGGLKNMRVPLFFGYGGMAFSWGYAPDPVGGALYQAQTLTARTDAVPQNALPLQSPGRPFHFYSDKPEAIKRIGDNGELLLNATAAHPMGEGVPLDAQALLNLNGIATGARDGWILNESRLDALRRRNIVNDGLERLHAEARDHLDRGAEASQGRRHALARAHDIAAACLSNRIYGPLRRISDDLVQAVVVLLLLSIPFAFALERLIFGFTSIYLQVLGFAGFFLGTFLLLFFTHPAFALADSPVVIFLAFVIILLSATVLAIVMSKIRQEIRAIQGLASTVHGTGSDNSTALAAVFIGIAGMRNRPMKTSLTAITVVLLTFTILVFASFGSRYGVVETFLGRGGGEDRIELRRHSHLHLDNPLIESIRQLYDDRCQLFRRGGIFRNPVRGTPAAEADRILHCPRSGRTVGVGAFWGVERGELARNEPLGALLPALLTPAPTSNAAALLLLPDAIADALATVPGDTLLIGGARFCFAGRFDALRVQALTAIDGGRVLPPNFEQTLQALNIGGDQNTLQTLLEQTDAGSFEWFTGENVAIADYGDLVRLLPGQPFVNGLVLLPRTADVDLMAIARELAPVFQGAVHVKQATGASRLHFTQVVAGSGFGDVIVPLLLGGLIIFSSLMGSIVDRQREIFTYSALGLSPPDIGMLFFAESSVYAVIGGIGGYLLGQVAAKLVNFLGAHGVIDAPEMNFSSLGSVLTILVVMALVGLSTIYPALRASRAASPGVARSWRMPAPVGDRFDFVFPFTVSEADFAGILSFIREHFENHADATLGDFAARDVHLFREAAGDGGGGPTCGIAAEISLAPFDLGIFQRFRLCSRPFEIPGIGEVVVSIERIGGSPAAWVRGNRKFAADLRHQFLLWRSLPAETIEHYRRRTVDEWKGTS